MSPPKKELKPDTAPLFHPGAPPALVTPMLPGRNGSAPPPWITKPWSSCRRRIHRGRGRWWYAARRLADEEKLHCLHYTVQESFMGGASPRDCPGRKAVTLSRLAEKARL